MSDTPTEVRSLSARSRAQEVAAQSATSSESLPERKGARKPKKKGATRKRATSNQVVRNIRQQALVDWFIKEVHDLFISLEPFPDTLPALHKALNMKVGGLPFSTFQELCRSVGIKTAHTLILPDEVTAGPLSLSSSAAPSGEGQQTSSVSPSLEDVEPDDDDEPLFDNEVKRPNALNTR